MGKRQYVTMVFDQHAEGYSHLCTNMTGYGYFEFFTKGAPLCIDTVQIFQISIRCTVYY